MTKHERAVYRAAMRFARASNSWYARRMSGAQADAAERSLMKACAAAARAEKRGKP